MTAKRILIFLAIFLQLSAAPAFSADRGRFEAVRGKVEGNYDFWIYTPSEYDDDDHAVPLIVFLHGASLCGHNLDRVRRYGVLDAIEKGKNIPALVLAPQNGGGAWNPDKLNGLLEWTKQNYRVDTTRIYVLGMSLGGYGTLDFAAAYPEKIAAAMALCGGCSSQSPDGLGRLPLWIIHCQGDRAVSVKQSQRVVDYLQQNGADKLLRYDWLKGGSHGILARLFYLQKTYDWLFAHSTLDRPRSVNHNFEIDYSDINQTYEELKWFRNMYDED